MCPLLCYKDCLYPIEDFLWFFFAFIENIKRKAYNSYKLTVLILTLIFMAGSCQRYVCYEREEETLCVLPWKFPQLRMNLFLTAQGAAIQWEPESSPFTPKWWQIDDMTEIYQQESCYNHASTRTWVGQGSCLGSCLHKQAPLFCVLMPSCRTKAHLEVGTFSWVACNYL